MNVDDDVKFACAAIQGMIAALGSYPDTDMDDIRYTLATPAAKAMVAEAIALGRHCVTEANRQNALAQRDP
jgi:hypothetical protein